MKRILLGIIMLLCTALPATAGVFDPLVYDINIYAGEDYILGLTLTAGNNVPVDLTGYSFRAQFRSAPAPAGAVFATFSTVVTNPTAGTLDIKLSHGWTASMAGKSGTWDLMQTDSTGAVSYILRGKALVQPTVTR